MPNKTSEMIFLSLSEAEDHQKGIKDWETYPDEEIYPQGIRRCMARLDDNTMVTAWASTWIRYYG
jgi:hypothetical protein